jgi:hypothetical protein
VGLNPMKNGIQLNALGFGMEWKYGNEIYEELMNGNVQLLV